MALHPPRYCACCRFWLEGSSPSDGYGWCQNLAVKSEEVSQDAVYPNREGNAGLETYAASVCPRHEPQPIRYRKKQ